MTREVKKDEEIKLRVQTALVAENLIRIGRSYIECVTAPNMEENEAAHKNFAKNLGDFVILLIESGIRD